MCVGHYSHLFHFRNVPNESSIVHNVIQLLQLAEVLHIFLPDHLKRGQTKLQLQQRWTMILSAVFLSPRQLSQTSAISSASPGLQSSSQRLGVMPLVLF